MNVRATGDGRTGAAGAEYAGNDVVNNTYLGTIMPSHDVHELMS
jgi:hypothetical protein